MGITTLQLFGTAVLFVVLLQLSTTLFVSLRELRYRNEQHRRSLELLSAQIERVRAQRQHEERVAELSWQGFRKLEVRRKTVEGKSGICSFEFVPHDGKPLPPYLPGQYLTFQLTIPGRPAPTVRCYSLSDCFREATNSYRVTIKKALPPLSNLDAPPGLASSYFHDQVQEGDILDVKAPAGNFVLDLARDVPVVLLAGGVGLTPLLSMLNAIVESGSKRETWFFYGVRNAAEHIMQEHFDRIRRECQNVHIRICYGKADAGEVEAGRCDHVGFVSIDLLKQELPSNDFEFYLCGPPPMMSMLTQGLADWGVPAERIKFEAFGPASVKSVKPISEKKESQPSAAEIRFSKTGKTVPWNDEAGSLLDLAEANGIDIQSGCRAGSCGTCKVAVRKGEVDYRQAPDTDCEPGSCLACIAVPKGDLTLDA